MKAHIGIIAGAAIALGALVMLSVSTASSREPDAPHAGDRAPIVTGPVATPTCAPSWAVVSSPSVGSTESALYGVDAVAADDVWAVGVYVTAGASNQRDSDRPKSELLPPGSPSHSTDGYIWRTLIERWNGSTWTIVPSPNVGSDTNSLFMVDAVSANDVWAVGYYVNEFGVAQTLTLRWNGSQWSAVPSPNAGPLFDNRLISVEAISSSDVWAVGSYFDEEGNEQTLTLHWNGTRWDIVPSPNLGEYSNVLYDVAVVSANDVWAVGIYVTSAGISRSLTIRWDGVRWNVVAAPAIGSRSNVLYSVDAVGPNDVWAVGALSVVTGGTRMLTLHWDGAQWTPVVAPPTDASYNILNSVDAVASNDVWAVGYHSEYSGQPLTLHWDGATWSRVYYPGIGPDFYPSLYSVDALSSQDVWAVGQAQGYSGYGTFVGHYSTACVTCPTRFSDVPEGSPFYHAIQCVACLGIVGGYEPTPPPYPTPVPTGEPYPTWPPTPPPTATPAGPTFRPNANVTRGQFAKIVSNAANFHESAEQQMFEDVPPYSPFYVWINRLARRGIVGGYQCGTSPDEPCRPPANLPYFRPYADSTRGQIAKMVSNAAGFNEPHTEQNFADVPGPATGTPHPFYIWIARLSSRGVIGGYQCGSAPHEPCDPANRPYFRSGANTTRGQVSKMVAKTFFPNCYVP